MLDVKIRFNTNYGKLPDQKKWRVIVDGKQHFTDEVEIIGTCYTSEDIVKGDDGNDVLKFHITTKAREIKNLEDKIIIL